MKRAGFVFFAVVLASLGTGCVSSGKAALLSQREPIALVSVISNWDINWKDEDSTDPNTLGPLAKRTLRSDPGNAIISNADGLINNAEDLIRETMSSSGVIHFADKETVLRSNVYQKAEENKYQISHEMVKPIDYRFIDFRDKNFPGAFAAETGIQRIMFVEFTFTKAMATGVGKNGSCKAMVDMTVSIVDAQGKSLYKQTVSLASRDSTKISNGVYSQSGLMSLFDSAVTDACYEFMDDLQY